MENNRNHPIILNKAVIGYFSLDISDHDRPKYQIKDCVQMVISILREKNQFNENFLFHSTVPCHPDMQDKIKILNGNCETICQANNAIAHCISANAKVSKGFLEKPTLDNFRISFGNLRGHAVINNITKTTTPKIGCRLGKFQWTDVFELKQETFMYSGIQIQIITKKEIDSTRTNDPSNNEHYVENK